MLLAWEGLGGADLNMELVSIDSDVDILDAHAATGVERGSVIPNAQKECCNLLPELKGAHAMVP